MEKVRIIAFYLPQFHPTPDNDRWWGKGFTEWTNVAKAKPLFRGHYQPHIPADLGFYDLRLPEAREAQAEMARDAGIEGFCYWHYWFGKGKRLLERPFNEVLTSGKPDFPFCLGWANHDWTNKSWEKGMSRTKEEILMKQTYEQEDIDNHFYDVLPAFMDSRYITVDGKPLFVVYDPLALPNSRLYINRWQELAKRNSLKGIHFVGIISNLSGFRIDDAGHKKYYMVKASEEAGPRYKTVLSQGFDAVNSRGQFRAELISNGRIFKYLTKIYERVKSDVIKKYNYADIIEHLFVPEDRWEDVYPTILSGWDRTPRSGKKADIYYNTTPDLFKKHLQDAITIVQNKSTEHRILFLMSWNEWGEGNYVEPDLKYGRGFLDAIRECVINE
mgnify:CR=1 FL=1